MLRVYFVLRRRSWREFSPVIVKVHTSRITPLNVWYLLMYNKHHLSMFAQKWKPLLALLIGCRWREQSVKGEKNERTLQAGPRIWRTSKARTRSLDCILNVMESYWRVLGRSKKGIVHILKRSFCFWRKDYKGAAVEPGKQGWAIRSSASAPDGCCSVNSSRFGRSIKLITESPPFNQITE